MACEICLRAGDQTPESADCNGRSAKPVGGLTGRKFLAFTLTRAQLLLHLQLNFPTSLDYLSSLPDLWNTLMEYSNDFRRFSPRLDKQSLQRHLAICYPEAGTKMAEKTTIRSSYLPSLAGESTRSLANLHEL